MAATAAPLPPFCRVRIAGHDTLEFSDGYKYTFTVVGLLTEATNVESAAPLGRSGEFEMWRILDADFSNSQNSPSKPRVYANELTAKANSIDRSVESDVRERHEAEELPRLDSGR